MLVTQENGEEDLAVIEEQPEMETPEILIELLRVEIGDATELSLSSVVGFTTPGTIELRGRLHDQEVVILVDCGATHNFIAQRLVDILQLLLTSNANYGVIMGLSTTGKRKGVCKNVELFIGNFKIVERLLLLEFRGVDIILGM